VLISFGARRRKGNVKKEEKKPVEWFKPFNLKLLIYTNDSSWN
jgi:hypothetical protein